jgi:hypothetical protein
VTTDAFTYVDSLRARVGEPLWAELVDFFADWIERDSIAGGLGVGEQWRTEMAARPEAGEEGE